MGMLNERLNAVYRQLLAAHSGNAGMATAAIGREREDFIDIFLRNCISPAVRFGTGQILDSTGLMSRQLDIVVESPFAPTIPLLGSSNVRLYLAESVHAIIEVKSDLTSQWNEVRENFESVKALKCKAIGGASLQDPRISENMVYFAVGYTGWEKEQSLIKHWRNNAKPLDCVLQLNPLRIVHKKAESNDPEIIDGPMALLRIVELLSRAVTQNVSSGFDLTPYFHITK
jgi:hypothetical protein